MAPAIFSHALDTFEPGSNLGESDRACEIRLEAEGANRNSNLHGLSSPQTEIPLSDNRGPVPCGSGNSRPQQKRLSVLDVFCGLGGASDGFALEGFDVLGIDIEDMQSKGYKHPFIRADIFKLKGENFQGFDVIWLSPTCRDFSRLVSAMGHIWKDPPNPERGLKCISCALKFVEDAEPRFWILENVSGLTKYLDLKPRIINAHIKGQKRHVFYGNFPDLLVPQTESKLMVDFRGPSRSWQRAKIPLACSRAFARACKEALLSKA